MRRLVFRALICMILSVFILTQAPQASYALRPMASVTRLRSVFVEIQKFLSAPQEKEYQIPDSPPDYLTIKLTEQEYKKSLKEIDGAVVYISMEIFSPELRGKDGSGWARGGLGYLAGDVGEGLAEAILKYKIPGVKSFEIGVMYENRVVARTSLTRKRQTLSKEKIDYNEYIDEENFVDYRILADPDRFSYPELEINPDRPIKKLVDENHKQIKLQIVNFSSRENKKKKIDIAAYVTSRGGTPLLLIDCETEPIYGILYSDDEAGKLEQQVLFGKAVAKLSERIGLKTAILHSNEAHTARAMAEVIQNKYFKDTALVFTIHTPIETGKLKYYHKAGWFDRLDLPDTYQDDRGNTINFKEVFIDNDGNLNFSQAAMKMSHITTAVSEKHKITTQKMFPEDSDKIIGILNGVGKIWKGDNLKVYEEEMEIKRENPSPAGLWDAHQKDKLALMEFLNKEKKSRSDSLSENMLNMPWVGAVRRIDFYKQQYPMLKDIIRVVCADKGKKVKIVVDDYDGAIKKYCDKKGIKAMVIDEGKRIEMELEGLGMVFVLGGIIVDQRNDELQGWIRNFIDWMQDPDLKGRFIFVSGNEFELMKKVGAGCDTWVEMPRPRDDGTSDEASGTSGMRAATNGNPPIVTKGCWGDEWIKEYDPETGEGNGFFIEEDNQIALYNALQKVSKLYYGYDQRGDAGLLLLRQKVHKQAKVLYIEEVVKRYVMQAYQPAIRLKAIEDSIEWTGNIQPADNETQICKAGDEQVFSADIRLNDPKLIEYIEAEIWITNPAGKQVKVVMENVTRLPENSFRFTGKFVPESTGDYSYEVRFNWGNARYRRLPKGKGSRGKILVEERPEVEVKLALKDAIERIGNIYPDISRTHTCKQGDELLILAEIELKDPKLIDKINLEIWNDTTGKFQAVAMQKAAQTNNGYFIFSGKITALTPGLFKYKIRANWSTKEYKWAPEGTDNDGTIEVKENPAEELPRPKPKIALKDAIEHIGNIYPDISRTRTCKQGDELLILADIKLKDPKLIDKINLEIWNDTTGKFQAVAMQKAAQTNNGYFIFSGKITPAASGHFKYKIRANWSTKEYKWAPEGMDNDGRIFVEELPKSKAESYKIKDEIEEIGNLYSSVTKKYKVGDRAVISAYITFKNHKLRKKLIKKFKAEIWSNADGEWKPYAMERTVKQDDNGSIFKGELPLKNPGKCEYKVRFNWGTDEDLYTPEGANLFIDVKDIPRVPIKDMIDWAGIVSPNINKTQEYNAGDELIINADVKFKDAVLEQNPHLIDDIKAELWFGEVGREWSAVPIQKMERIDNGIHTYRFTGKMPLTHPGFFGYKIRFRKQGDEDYYIPPGWGNDGKILVKETPRIDLLRLIDSSA